MEGQFLNLGRIDCSAFFEHSKEESQESQESQESPKKCFDVAHISLEELEQIKEKFIQLKIY